jgi:hypothetical protein
LPEATIQENRRHRLKPVEEWHISKSKNEQEFRLHYGPKIDSFYVFVGWGMSKSLQIFFAKRSSTSECRGTDDLLFLEGLPHHE